LPSSKLKWGIEHHFESKHHRLVYHNLTRTKVPLKHILQLLGHENLIAYTIL
jgi:hypothetical protein